MFSRRTRALPPLLLLSLHTSLVAPLRPLVTRIARPRHTLANHDVTHDTDSTLRAREHLHTAHNHHVLHMRVHRKCDVPHDRLLAARLHALPFARRACQTAASGTDRHLAVLQRRHGAHRATRRLADLRDALLPKLISGEIRVPEAEAAVGAAL